MSLEKVRGTTLRTVERALDVLEIVAQSSGMLQIKEVADKLDHNLTSTYHIVNTLIAREYLSKDVQGGLIIGRRIGVLNASLVRAFDFNADVRPLIAKLASDSGETVYLTRLINASAVIQMVVESQHSLRVTGLDVGYSGSEDHRASGKAVLAHMSEPDLLNAFAKLHPEILEIHGSSRFASLVGELAEIRRQGYAFDNEDYELGVCCVAAPYFMPDGTVGGSVAASAPALRVDRLRDHIRNQVTTTAEFISQLLTSSAAV